MAEPTTRKVSTGGVHDADELAAGYSSGHRAYEIGGMVVASGLAVWLAARIATAGTTNWFLWPLAAFAGMIIADFISGFVHWMFDTWGSVDTPVVGKLAIRTFRHHHVDPRAMTKHDFIETNGHNFALTVIYTGIGFTFVEPAETDRVSIFFAQTFLMGTAFVMVTSQFHKWAHQKDVHWSIRFLQRSGLALNPDHHRAHHTAPYDQHYCVTSGWMNGPLRAVGFFRGLEWLVTSVTGAIPRRDDIGEAAAVEAAKAASAERETETQAGPGQLAPDVFTGRDSR